MLGNGHAQRPLEQWYHKLCSLFRVVRVCYYKGTLEVLSLLSGVTRVDFMSNESIPYCHTVELGEGHVPCPFNRVPYASYEGRLLSLYHTRPSTVPYICVPVRAVFRGATAVPAT